MAASARRHGIDDSSSICLFRLCVAFRVVLWAPRFDPCVPLWSLEFSPLMQLATVLFYLLPMGDTA
jgi:hypothetical protein